MHSLALDYLMILQPIRYWQATKCIVYCIDHLAEPLPTPHAKAFDPMVAGIHIQKP
jgi:hypothetical protein